MIKNNRYSKKNTRDPGNNTCHSRESGSLITFILFVLLLLGFTTANADQTTWPPKGCGEQHFAFQQNVITLGTDQKSNHLYLYVFYNSSNFPFIINHEPKHPAASAGWASQINPHHFSALLSNQPNFTMTCGRITPGHYQYYQCKALLKACAISQFTTPDNSSGSYWAAENQNSYSDLINAMAQRGFRF